MTAALYNEKAVTAAPRLHVVREDEGLIPMPAPEKVVCREYHYGDPLVDGAARLLSIPVRHVYAALLRIGVLEVQG